MSRVVRLAAAAMGTRFELVLAGEDEASLRAAGEDAIAEIEDWHRRLSVFDPASTISRVNAGAVSGSVTIDLDTALLLVECQRLWRETGGAFDPTIGALMNAHGFRGSPTADESTIANARNATGMGKVRLTANPPSVRFETPGLALDLGGIAKGWALDRAASLLREAGVTRALLHGGTSSVSAIGAPPDAPAWQVEIRPPAAAPTDLRVVASLRDSSLSVSAPHGKVVRTAEGESTHVLDPRSGLPARAADLAAVIMPQGVDAEGWSTAMVVGGAAVQPPAGASFALCLGGRWQTRGEGFTIRPRVEGIS